MTRSVLVIGGGPAGLTAALRLAELRYAVTLAEEQDGLAGRLHASSTVHFGSDTAAAALLRSVDDGFPSRKWRPARLEIALPDGRVHLRRPWLPGPVHGLCALATFGGLGLADRWHALTLVERTWEGAAALPPDLDAHLADEWLAQHGQSAQARAQVWSPLARVLLGSDLHTASAAQFVRAIHRHLLGARRAGKILVAEESLHQLAVGPLAARLRDSGAELRLNTPVTRLEFAHDRIASVRLEAGDRLTAQWYVLALPHQRVCSLLPDRLLTRYAYFEQLTRLRDVPAVVVRLGMRWGDPHARLVLRPSGTFHWIVVPGAAGPCRPLTLVATDCPALLHRSDEELRDLALTDLQETFPHSCEPAGDTCEIVRDPHAFLCLSPGAAMLRPLARTPIPNLLLAGAWTDTGLPSTLESAVISGIRCAMTIAAQEG